MLHLFVFCWCVGIDGSVTAQAGSLQRSKTEPSSLALLGSPEPLATLAAQEEDWEEEEEGVLGGEGVGDGRTGRQTEYEQNQSARIRVSSGNCCKIELTLSLSVRL